MLYADLLQQAKDLALRDPTRPKQASFGQAMSVTMLPPNILVEYETLQSGRGYVALPDRTKLVLTGGDLW